VPLESAIAIEVLPIMVTSVWRALCGGGFRPLMCRFGTMRQVCSPGGSGVISFSSR
jgi:hypothetical protein